jgi:hypothetical protein
MKTPVSLTPEDLNSTVDEFPLESLGIKSKPKEWKRYVYISIQQHNP